MLTDIQPKAQKIKKKDHVGTGVVLRALSLIPQIF